MAPSRCQRRSADFGCDGVPQFRRRGTPVECGRCRADLLQEIFLQAYRKLPEFRGDSAVGTWLYRLAMNRCLDYLKSRQTRASGATSPLDEQTVSGPRLATDGGVKRLDLERAIGKLPEGARAAFVLHDVEGFQHHEIAAILGISEGTSKSQVHKARLKLRILLTETI